MRRLLAGIGLACVLVGAGCGHEPERPREPPRPRKTELTRLPKSVDAVTVADDASSHAYRIHDDPPVTVAIVHNGVRGPTYAATTPATFSPITHRLFYWAGHEMDRGSLVADGKEVGKDIGRQSTIVFSRDGTRWATTAALHDGPGGEDDPGPVVVLADGREIAAHPDASLPTFSPDGRHLAYLAAGPEGTKLIVDGEQRKSFALPAGHCAVRARPHKREINPNYWPQFQARYLSDGRLLVMTHDADGWGIYRDDTRLASYPSSIEQSRPSLFTGCETGTAVAAWSLTAAEKAPVAAWWERLPGAEERWRMVMDGRPVDDLTCSKAWLNQPADLTPDGRHIAYACTVEQPESRVFLVADGKRYGPYWDLWAYTWAEDGSHVAYGAAEDPSMPIWHYYVDGSARSAPMTNVWRPLLEPGTGKMAWEGRPTENERGVVGIDRRRLATFDDVVWGPRFLEPGTVTWVLRRGRRVVRLDVPTR